MVGLNSDKPFAIFYKVDGKQGSAHGPIVDLIGAKEKGAIAPLFLGHLVFGNVPVTDDRYHDVNTKVGNSFQVLALPPVLLRQSLVESWLFLVPLPV